MINSTLQNRFNSAANLFSEGNFEEALIAYQDLFSPNSQPNTEPSEIETPSELFSLEVRLRTAFCLIELGRFAEAKFEFETESMHSLLAHAGPVQREAYLFSYGNLLAKTGCYEAGDEALARAQEIATNQLNDSGSIDRICRYRLHWANHYGHWSQLLELAQQFRILAQTNDLVGLMHWSSEAVCFALRGLHQYAEAKQGAEQIYGRLQNAGARPEHVAVWGKFISDIAA